MMMWPFAQVMLIFYLGSFVFVFSAQLNQGHFSFYQLEVIREPVCTT